MAYRVIFLFGIGELYPQIEEAVQNFHCRVPPHRRSRRTVRECVEFWFMNELYENLHLAIAGRSSSHWLFEMFDVQFQVETCLQSQRLYRQIGAAVLNHQHPCFESFCTVTITPTELRLTFDIGAIAVSQCFQ